MLLAQLSVAPSEVVAQQRLKAAKLYLQDLHELYGDLAVSSRFSDEMKDLAPQGAIWT